MHQKWFETFFQGAAVEFWKRAIPPSVTEAEVEFLEKALGAGAGGAILDVPCGAGRHAIELAKRGYEMTGVDLSDEFLSAAKQGGIESLKQDMRALDLPADFFDGAYCWGNSFPYLDRQEAQQFFAALTRSVKRGGRFVLDTGCAAECILPSLLNKRWHRLGDLIVLSEARYNAPASRLDIDYTFIQGGVIETRPSVSFIFTAAEITALLQAAGFEVIAMNGGIAGEPFVLGSPRLIVTAERARHQTEIVTG